MSVNCPGGTVYTIKSGDTLFSLANRYGVTVEAIIAANPNINPDALQIGQQICIPPRTGPAPCPGGTLYTIKAGDTYFSLANRFGVTVEALTAANPGVDPNALVVGQQICIPPRTVPVPCPGGTLYTIKAGDTYFSLANRFGVTVQALVAANPGVDPNALVVGQQICIPPRTGPVPCPGGTLYTIKAGDTYFSLASRFGITVEALVAANPGVDPNALRVGQQICIPPSTTPVPCPGGTLYTIKAGDTLYAIGLRYGVTVSAILAANPSLEPNSLRVGQIICIPPRVVPPSPIPGVIVLNPTDLMPNARAWAGVEREMGSVVATVTNVPAPTTLPNGEVYKLWVRLPGATTWNVAIMNEVFNNYWVGRVMPGLPLTGAAVVISAETRANVTQPTGIAVATGTL